jgi:hypothetical protein
VEAFDRLFCPQLYIGTKATIQGEMNAQMREYGMDSRDGQRQNGMVFSFFHKKMQTEFIIFYFILGNGRQNNFGLIMMFLFYVSIYEQFVSSVLVLPQSNATEKWNKIKGQKFYPF